MEFVIDRRLQKTYNMSYMADLLITGLENVVELKREDGQAF